MDRGETVAHDASIYTPCSEGGSHVGVFPFFLSRTIWVGTYYNLTCNSLAEQRQKNG